MVVVGEDGLLAVLFDARDAAVAVLAEVQPALGIDERGRWSRVRRPALPPRGLSPV